MALHLSHTRAVVAAEKALEHLGEPEVVRAYLEMIVAEGDVPVWLDELMNGRSE